MGIEENLDVEFIAEMAFREKQMQQAYRPFIGIHKWFARRPGTLLRSLLLAEFDERPLRDTFFETNSLRGVRVADPFMGGGTSLAEANRLDCDILGYDVSPMSHWIVGQVFDPIDVDQYCEAANRVHKRLKAKLGVLYQTSCCLCLRADADVKYFLWVRTSLCSCGHRFDLFKTHLVAEVGRHPTNVFVCPNCGELTEKPHAHSPRCHACQSRLLTGTERKGFAECPKCRKAIVNEGLNSGPPEHRLYALEYHCPSCKPTHQGRFFKTPDPPDLLCYEQARVRWAQTRARFVPDDEIPWGPETNRLRRYGYRLYRELFNERQLLALETTAREISKCENPSIRRALFTNLSDLLRYQNMLCRYDARSLKSQDVFSFHGFPVGVTQCESNFLGIYDTKRPAVVGSGGWVNIVEKYTRAKQFCKSPYEVRMSNGKRAKVRMEESIGRTGLNGSKNGHRKVILHCASSTTAEVPPRSLSAVLTDPPYLANVRYSQLMDFCAVWLARFEPEFSRRRESFVHSTFDDISSYQTKDRGLVEYTSKLDQVFRRFAKGLETDGLFAFTFHHNKLEAYAGVVVALLNAGLRCTYCFPCPSEMSASIHISGRDASRFDMVFICRKVESDRKAYTPSLTRECDAQRARLARIGLEVKPADERSVLFGLAASIAVARLQNRWRKNRAVTDCLKEATDTLRRTVGPKKG